MHVLLFKFYLFTQISTLFFSKIKRVSIDNKLLAINSTGLFLVADTVSALTLFGISYFIYYLNLMNRNRSQLVYKATICFLILSYVLIQNYFNIWQSVTAYKALSVVGMSYVFFRILSFLIESNHRDLKAVTIVQYANYCLNFLCINMGPIQTYAQYTDSCQFNKSTPSKYHYNIKQMLPRLFIGLFKVVILASLMQKIHGSCLAHFNQSPSLTPYFYILGAISYMLYLYCQFSGYTDIILATGKFMGFNLPENFRKPWHARNYLEFWNRWHMSLGVWFRAYVFNPLLKYLTQNFKGKKWLVMNTCLSFFVTFLLIGLWHGTVFDFFLYALFMAVGASGVKLYEVLLKKYLLKATIKKLINNYLYSINARGFTLCYFSLTLYPFWITSTKLYTSTILSFKSLILIVLLTQLLITVMLIFSDTCEYIWQTYMIQKWENLPGKIKDALLYIGLILIIQVAVLYAGNIQPLVYEGI